MPFITLTAADRKWMDEIVTTVDNSWNAQDPSRPAGMNFVGSDDFIRAKFEVRLLSSSPKDQLLMTILTRRNTSARCWRALSLTISWLRANGGTSCSRGMVRLVIGEASCETAAHDRGPTEVDRNLMSSFNDRFVDALKATPAFTLWDATTDSVIFDLVEPKSIFSPLA